VNYSFDEGIALNAGETIRIVPFDPSVDLAKVTSFYSAYRLAAGSARLVGPWDGELSNRGERVSLERAQASDDDLRPDDVSWIIVDEVTWLDEEPWSDAADGMGSPLARVGSAGNDPDSWSIPADFDGDGIPDEWERSLQPGLNYFGFGDFDGDGQSDWAEYIAGTIPVDALSYLKYDWSQATDSGYLLNWNSVSGRVYNISWSSNLSLPFIPIVEELAYPKSSFTDHVYYSESAGFYRIGVWTNTVPSE
jgi:hypothetical protein